MSGGVLGSLAIVTMCRPITFELINSQKQIGLALVLRSDCSVKLTGVTGMKSITVSRTSARCLLIALLVAIAVRTSNGLLTNANCETHTNDSVTYHACIADPEHILRPGITTFNVSIEPPNSTCGLTPQTSCTLVCMSTMLVTLTPGVV